MSNSSNWADSSAQLLDKGRAQAYAQNGTSSGYGAPPVSSSAGGQSYSGQGSSSGLPGQGNIAGTPYYGGSPNASAQSIANYNWQSQQAQNAQAPQGQYGAANGTIGTAMGAYGAAQGADQSEQNALSLLQQAATGQTPSAAQIQQQQGIQQAIKGQLAAAAGARGGAYASAAAQQQAAQQGAGLAAQGIGQNSALRAQEMATAQQAYMQGAGQLQQGNVAEMGALQGLAGLQQQQGTSNAALQEQQNALNNQTALSYQGLGQNVEQDNLNAQLAALGYGTQMQESNNQIANQDMMGGIGLGTTALVGAGLIFSDKRAKTDVRPADGVRVGRTSMREPGGDSEWELREMPDFIAAINRRTGQVRRLVDAPVSAAQRRAIDRHGAGPVTRRVGDFGLDDGDPGLSADMGGLGAGGTLGGIPGLTPGGASPSPITAPSTMAGVTVPPATPPVPATAAPMPATPGAAPSPTAANPSPSAGMLGGNNAVPMTASPGLGTPSAVSQPMTNSGGMTKQEALKFLKGAADQALASGKPAGTPNVAIPTLSAQNPTGLQAGSLISDKEAKRDVANAARLEGFIAGRDAAVSATTRPDTLAQLRTMPPYLAGHDGYPSMVLSPMGYVKAANPQPTGDIALGTTSAPARSGYSPPTAEQNAAARAAPAGMQAPWTRDDVLRALARSAAPPSPEPSPRGGLAALAAPAPDAVSAASGGTTTSDTRAKTGSRDALSPVDRFLASLNPKTFEYKSSALEPNPSAPGNRYLGVMAQDVEKTPEGRKAVRDDGAGGLKRIDVPTMTGALAAGVGRLDERVRLLEKALGKQRAA